MNVQNVYIIDEHDSEFKWRCTHINWDGSHKVFKKNNPWRFPELLVVSFLHYDLEQDKRDMCGYWKYNNECDSYQRQMVGDNMMSQCFIDVNTKYVYTCYGVIGTDILHFQKQTVLDFIVAMNSKFNDMDSKFNDMESKFNILKNAVENLSFLPGMREFELASERWNERLNDAEAQLDSM